MATSPLIDVEYLSQEVTDLHLEGVHLETKFTGSTFTSSSFIKCRLDRVLMAKTIWKQCDFSDSTLVVYFNDAVFEDCKFLGTSFKGINGEYGGVRAKFLNCDFTGAKFIHVYLRACRFENCLLEGVEFIRCDLRGAKSNGLPLISA